MIVEVLGSFKVTDGTVYIGGTTIEVDRFGALNPDVQKELIKKSGFFKLIDGALPTAEPPQKKVEDAPPEKEDAPPEKEDAPPEKEDAPRFVGKHKGAGRWIVVDQETDEVMNEDYLDKPTAAALVKELEGSAKEPERTLPRKKE